MHDDTDFLTQWFIDAGLSKEEARASAARLASLPWWMEDALLRSVERKLGSLRDIAPRTVARVERHDAEERARIRAMLRELDDDDDNDDLITLGDFLAALDNAPDEDAKWAEEEL